MKRICFSCCLAVFFLISFTTTAQQDYFWVGDGGNWSDFSNHWATTSGGATFHTELPDTLDNVFFDANSFSIAGQDVNMDISTVVNNMDWTGVSNNPQLLSSGIESIAINGSLVLSSNATYLPFGGGFRFISDNAGNTITSNGADIIGSIRFEGTGDWRLTDDFTASDAYQMRIENGLLFTDGFAINTGGNLEIFGLGSIDLANSTITSNGWSFSGSTLVSGTAKIVLEDIYSRQFSQVSFSGGDQTYNILEVNYPSGRVEFFGNNTFDSLEFVAGSQVVFGGSQTQTTNALLLSGSPAAFTSLSSFDAGVQTSLVVNNVDPISVEWIQLKDINVSGMTTFTANNSFDLGNNTGWTINTVPPADFYWVGNGGNWNDFSNHWSTISGGPADHIRLPSFQDNVFFDANSFTAENQQVRLNVSASMQDMDWTGVQNNPLLVGESSNSISVFGSLILSSDASYQVFNGGIQMRSDLPGNNLITNNAPIFGALLFDGAGDWTLSGDLEMQGGYDLNVNQGTFNTNGSAVISRSFNTNNLGSVILGSSTITTIFWSPFGTSVDAGTSTIIIDDLFNSGQGGFFNTPGGSYHDLVFSNKGFQSSLTGDNTFNSIRIDPGVEVAFGAGQTQTTSAFTATGTISDPTSLISNSFGINATIELTAGTAEIYLGDIRDITASGAGTFLAQNSNDLGGNTGITFNPVPSIQSLLPLSGATDVPLNSNLEITFNEVVNPAIGNVSVFNSDGSIFEVIGAQSAQITGGGTATIVIDPVAPLAFDSSYYVTIDQGLVENSALDAYAGIGSASFWTFQAQRTPVNQTDSLALVTLYNSTNGGAWNNSENWLATNVGDWFGVTVEGDRVVSLDLSNNNLSGTLPAALGDLDAITVLNFAQNFNVFGGGIPVELSQLSNLVTLDLRGCQVGGDIPIALGLLSNLETLNLESTGITGTIPVEIGDLAALKILNLRFNSLSGDIPTSLGNLSNLNELYISFMSISGGIPLEFASLANLQELDLRGNQLVGDIPDLTGIGNLRQLQLAGNQLTGPIPAFIGNSSNLEFLDIGENNLVGDIPASFSSLSNLSFLNIRNNNFENLPDLSGLSNLTFFDVSFNRFRDGSIIPNLSVITENQGQIAPIDIADSLVLVDLYNQLNGPSWGQRDNWLQPGFLAAEWFGVNTRDGRVVSFRIPFNNASGTIPEVIGDLDALEELEISGSLELTGSLPASLNQLTSLRVLALAKNGLSGSIPPLPALTSLEELKLGENNFSGVVPPEIGDKTNLRLLGLAKNNLSGSIPSTFSQLTQLQRWNIRENRFSGLPDLTGLTQLNLFDVSLNLLPPADLLLNAPIITQDEGQRQPILESDSLALVAIYQATNGNSWNNSGRWLEPGSFVSDWFGVTVNGDRVVGLDIQSNNLFGTLPTELNNLSALEILGLSRNQLSGEFPDISAISSLLELRIGNNNFSGPVPSSFGDNVFLTKLGMSNNQFSGAIPANFTQLTSLDRWNISQNQLVDLPDLSVLTQLSYFNVSGNRFEADDLTPNLSIITQNDFQNPSFFVTDSTALVDLYNSTNGSAWLNNDNWLTGNLSTWHGVTVSDGRVTALDLSTDGVNNGGNNLQGTIPFSIGDLTALTNLDLAANSLFGEIPNTIGQLTELLDLNLLSNQLSGQIPIELTALSNLTSLSLQTNQLFGNIPPELGNMINLTGLAISSNQFSGEIPESLGNLQSLNQLFLSGNQLSGTIPDTLGTLSNLTFLRLDNNFLTGPVPATFANLSSLTTLFLQNNQLDQLPDLTGLTALSNFDLSQNQFTFSDLEPNSAIIAGDASQNQIGIGGQIFAQIGESVTLDLLLDPNPSGNDTYQWLQDGIMLAGETNLTLSRTVGSDDFGQYTLQVSNSVFPGLVLESQVVSLQQGVGITTNISVNTTWTTGTEYILDGTIYVEPGVTLTIEPGTIIKATQNNTALIVSKGATILAQGTALDPIIFTSVLDNIQQGQLAGNSLSRFDLGLWGGVSIAGNARISDINSLGTAQVGGFPDPLAEYGGSADTDNSGILEFVSIRHAGSFINPAGIFGALTLAGVGSGTIIQNIEVTASQQDGIAVLGGTIDVNNLLAYGVAEDGIETSESFSGSIDNFLLIGTGSRALNLGSPLGIYEGVGSTLSNGTIQPEFSQALAAFKPNTDASLSNTYFFGLDNAQPFEGYAEYIASGGSFGISSLEATIPDGRLASDFFIDGSDAFVTEVPELQNTVGAETSSYYWTYAFSQFALEIFGVEAPKIPALASDSLALVALYNSTGGDNWNNNDGWLQPGSFVQDWFGVTVSRDGRVTRIDLGGNNLNGEIPVEIGDLTALTHLIFGLETMAGNNFGGSNIPATIQNLTQLEVLGLARCGFSGEFPVEITNMSNLQKIDITFNQFNAIPATIGNMTGLSYVGFGFNAFTTVPVELYSLPAVDSLILSGNQLAGSLPGEVANMTSLRFLNLGANLYEGTLPAAYSSLVNLEEIRIWRMEGITGSVPSEWSAMTRLASVDLTDLSLSGEIPIFSGMQSVSFRGNQFSSISSDILTAPNLQFLDVSDNVLTTFPNIVSLSDLFSVDIRRNRFKNAALEVNKLFPNSLNDGEQKSSYSLSVTGSSTAGGTVTLTVTDSDTPQNLFQWYKNGERLADETASTLTLNSLDASDKGIYYCLVYLQDQEETTGINSEAATIDLDITDFRLATGVAGGGASSEGGLVDFVASQAFGLPNIMAPNGQSENGWAPAQTDENPTLELAFESPAPINTIWIYGAAASVIESIEVFNNTTSEYEIITGALTTGLDLGDVREVNFPTTSFPVDQLRINGFNSFYRGSVLSIDAVAIGDNGIEINTPINLFASIVTRDIINLSWGQSGGTDSTAYFLERSIDDINYQLLGEPQGIIGFTRFRDANVPDVDTVYYRVKSKIGDLESPYTESILVERCLGEVSLEEGSYTTTATESSPVGGNSEGGKASFVKNSDGTITINNVYGGYLGDLGVSETSTGVLSSGCDGELALTLPGLGTGCGASREEVIQSIEFFPENDSLVYVFSFVSCDIDVTVSFVKDAIEPVQAAPLNLNLNVASSSATFLRWIDNSTFEDSFVIERSTDGVSFTEIAVVDPLPQRERGQDAEFESYVDNTVSLGVEYFYQVKARNASGDSEPSNQQAVTIFNPLFNQVLSGSVVDDKPSQTYSGTWADLDGDRDLDLYVTNWFPNEDPATVSMENYYYRNDGAGNFTKNTTSALVLGEFVSRGAFAGDFDNDGNMDLFVNGQGSSNFVDDARNFLFYGNGSGGYVEEGEFASDAYNVGIADINGDGLLDILNLSGFEVNINLGDRQFESRDVEDYIPGFLGNSWANLTPDLNGDGLPDLIVNGDARVDVFINDNTTPLRSVYNNEQLGLARGAVFGDFDHDLDIDIIIAARSGATTSSVYLRNNGDESFTELAAGQFLDQVPLTQRGLTVLDYDNDGNDDLLWLVETVGKPRLFKGQGDGTFTLVTENEANFPVINAFSHPSVGDFDDDGFQDLFISNFDPSGAVGLFRNNAGSNNYLKIDLEGNTSNRLGIGSQIEVKAGGVWQMKQVTSTNGLWSPNEITAHFGLGTATVVDSVIVRWTSGQENILADIAVNDRIRIKETRNPPPRIAINPLITNERSPALSGTVSSPDALVEIDLPEGVFTAQNNQDGTWTLPAGSIVPGLRTATYDVLARAIAPDTIGIDSTINELLVDVTAPLVDIDFLGTSVSSPEITGFVDDSTATIILTVNEVEYTDVVIDGNVWSLPEGTITPGLSDGIYEIIASSIDSLGNEGLDLTENELTITTEIIALSPSRITSRSFRANWSRGTDAISYRLDVSANSDFSTFVDGYENVIVNRTDTVVNGLDFSTDYFYRVRFENTANEISGNSDVITLTTGVLDATLADFQALASIYRSNGGPEWTDGGGWTEEERLQDWDFIQIDDQRVVSIDLSDNNLVGIFPLKDSLSQVTTIDISGNSIEGYGDLSQLEALTTLNVDNNKLLFDDIEQLFGKIDNFSYQGQASIKFVRDQDRNIEVDQGESFFLSVNTPGSGNTFRFFREDLNDANAAPVEVEDGESFSVSGSIFGILETDFDNMGIMSGQVESTIIDDLVIPIDTVGVYATATVSVRVVDPNGETTLDDRVNGYLLFTSRLGQIGFDTLEAVLDVPSTFEFSKVILGNYLIAVESDPEKYVPTYFSNTFLWDEADTIQFREDSVFNLDIVGEPLPLTEEDGEGTLGVLVEEDFAEGDAAARIDARRRAARRKCGLRKRRTGGRTDQDEDIFDLIAYGETNDNGEFEFGFLPQGDYRFFVEYPGIPLDENAFVAFTVGEVGISDTEFKLEAFATADGIEVEIEKVLGVILDYFKNLKIYPNPSSDYLYIKYRHLKSPNVRAQLVDLSGNVLWDEKVRQGYEGDIQINVNDFTEGMYILRFFDEKSRTENVVSYRVIVNK